MEFYCRVISVIEDQPKGFFFFLQRRMMFIFDFVFYFCWYNSSPSLRSWYKDGEQLVTSIPGYIVMKDRDLRIVANEFNEGTYTCRVHRRGNVVSANSWAIRLKPERSSNSWWGPAWVNQGTVRGGKRAPICWTKAWHEDIFLLQCCGLKTVTTSQQFNSSARNLRFPLPRVRSRNDMVTKLDFCRTSGVYFIFKRLTSHGPS